MTRKDHIRQIALSAAVVTVSISRTRETDTSGKTIMDLLNSAGIRVVHYNIVPDLIEAIQNEVSAAMEKADCIILNGGTGLTHDDCTIEAMQPQFDKRIDGFGELFRMKSFAEIGTAAMLSRAVAGVIHGKVIFCLPGSTPAVTLATKELIIPELNHIISHATKL